MKEKGKLQNMCGSNRVHYQPSLAIHKDYSNVISKFKPKIRIVHIFAPEIIKTDVSNFRELVQSLTGKPPSSSISDRKVPKKKTTRNDNQVISSSQGHKLFMQQTQTRMSESTHGFQRSCYGDYHHDNHNQDIIKDEDQEEASWGGENSSSTTSAANNNYVGGGGFSDIETYFQGFSHEFPLLPLNSNHMEMFGETYIV